ncbi:MAG: hydrogenase maturation protease [Bacteroidota bacterium]
MGNATLVIGIGNRYRGDDALGCLVVDKLRKRSWKGVDVIEHDGEPASLIELWQGYSSVIIVDAVVSGAKSDTIHRIDLHKQYLPTNFGAYSSHGIGVTEAVELARALDKLPPRIIFLGLEGTAFAINTQTDCRDQLTIVTMADLVLKEIVL